MTRRTVLAIARSVATLAATCGLALLAWVLILDWFHVSPLIGVRPATVWKYLFASNVGATHRSLILENLAVTVGHAALGLVCALAAAFVIAIGFSMGGHQLEVSVTPLLLTLRTVPIVVLTPLITFVVGANVLAVIATAFLVVFFPAIILILQGLRGAPSEQLDVVQALGGRRGARLRLVQLPSAMPAVSTALRVSVPAAMTGALIAEWLAIGEGLGGLMSRASGSFDYVQMWAAMVLITVVTMLAYAIANVLDVAICVRYRQLANG